MNKKADANMWWIIVGAVIALVVMIVLMVMFTSKGGKVESSLLDCQSKGGVCVNSEAECVKTDSQGNTNPGTISSAFTCVVPTQLCCFGGDKPLTVPMK